MDAVKALDGSDATKTAIADALKALNPGSGLTVADLEQAASGEEFNGLDEATRQANERASKIRQAVSDIAGKKDNSKRYVFLAGMGSVEIWKYSDNSEAQEIVNDQTVQMDVSVQNEKGFAVPYLDGTVTNESVIPTGLKKLWLLTTVDGARYVYDGDNGRLKSAASLIG